MHAAGSRRQFDSEAEQGLPSPVRVFPPASLWADLDNEGRAGRGGLVPLEHAPSRQPHALEAGSPLGPRAGRKCAGDRPHPPEHYLWP